MKDRPSKPNICIVTSFFYPSFGGIETHSFCLAQQLLKAGHKVIVVAANTQPTRQGVRYMTNGLKVYYLPLTTSYFPKIAGTFFLNSVFCFRDIVHRERIELVHAHQIYCLMGMECMQTANALGIATVLTMHSIEIPSDFEIIFFSSIFQTFKIPVDNVICVSQACKKFAIAVMHIAPEKIFVIPNAIDFSDFKNPNAIDSSEFKNLKNPNAAGRSGNDGQVRIIVMGRLVMIKGINIVLEIIPQICKKFARAHFVIVGDGPKKIELIEMCKVHGLHDRVTIERAVPHHLVAQKLRSADIFLSCSLSESFGLAVLEALYCGLEVIATKVGAIPEIVPPHLLRTVAPEAEKVRVCLEEAIESFDRRKRVEIPQEIVETYSWREVTERTVKVYGNALGKRKIGFVEQIRMVKRDNPGHLKGKVAYLLFLFAFLALLDYLFPPEEIDKAVDLRIN